MAQFNYTKMKATADRLLERFAQGDVQSVTVVTTTPPQSWEDPVETETRTSINAVVRGVSSQFVDGVTILATDLQVLSSAAVPTGARMEINGQTRVIVRHDKIPAAGVTVAHRYFVR